MNTKASSSTEMVFKGASSDPYKPVMHKWILKDYHQLENAYECGRTHTQSLDRESRKDLTLGNPPLPPVTALRLD